MKPSAPLGIGRTDCLTTTLFHIWTTKDLDDLEKSNLEFAGKLLSEFWGTMNVDGHPVHVSYVNSGEPELSVEPQIKWYSDHDRESQYLLQVVKSKDGTCCLRPRSGFF